MPDETSFTQNDEGWDDATSHEEMPSDHNSYVDYLDTSCKTFDGRDTMTSFEEEQESGNTFESRVETPTDDVSNEDMIDEMCFNPSYICKDLFNHKDSNGELLHLDLTALPGLSDKERCCRDNQDVRPAFQQPEEQVALHLSRVDTSSFWALSYLFFEFGCHLTFLHLQHSFCTFS